MMLGRFAILVVATVVLPVLPCQFTAAQDGNPLRVLSISSRPPVDALTKNQQVQPTAKQIHPGNRVNAPHKNPIAQHQLGSQRNQMPPEVHAAIYQTSSDAAPDQNQSKYTGPMQADSDARPMVDGNLQTAAYTRPAQPSSANEAGILPIVNVLDSLEKKHGSQLGPDNRGQELLLFDRQMPTDVDAGHSLLGATRSKSHVGSSGVSPKSKTQDLRALIEQLAIGTAVVICFGIGFIFIAKQWLKIKSPTKAGSTTKIQITSTLRLSPKSSLFLIEAGDQRLVVANDQNGIKSVVPLTDSFGGSFESMLGTEAAQTGGTEVTSAVEEPAGSYSLATVGAAQAAKSSSQDAEDGPAQDPVWEKMEAALSEYGLKELFLQTVKSQKSQ